MWVKMHSQLCSHPGVSGMFGPHCDPSIRGVIDPVRRVEISQNERVRIIVFEDGVRVPISCEHNKVPFFISPGVA